MNLDLTIAIVTKKRPLKLARCLESVCNQTKSPRQILLVDNDLDMSAYPIFKKYSKRLPIRYLLEKSSGVPYARNKALTSAKTKYLGFIDDDCILSDKWVESAINATNKIKGITYVCGKTYLYNKKNIFAIAQYTRDSYWYSQKIQKNKDTIGENFDTKNVVFNRNIIMAKKLRFDSKCGFGDFDSADFDFGLQLNHKSLNGFFSEKMRLYHEETSSLRRYVQRAYFRGKIAGYINKKWKLDDSLVDLSERSILIWLFKSIKKMPKDFTQYTPCLKIPLYNKILVVIIIRIYEAAYLNGYLNFGI